MLNGLDLFSGIGGISLALRPWVRTVCYVEIDRYCQAVIRSRIGDGNLDDAPIWDDIQTFDPSPWNGKVDIISGGFPCQDISIAGKGAGLEGKRSGLFSEIMRCASILRPSFIFLENVPAILGRGGGAVISEIASLGYDARWGILSAFDVGAPHLRERWWLLAHSNKKRCKDKDILWERRTSNSWILAEIGGQNGWKTKPKLDRLVHGAPYWVDRISGTGNTVVPQCAREAFIRLMGITI